MVRCTSLDVTHCLIDLISQFFSRSELSKWRFRARSPNPQVKSYHGKSETVINNCSPTSRLISHKSPDSSCRVKRNTRQHRDGGDTSVGILNEEVSYGFVRVCVLVCLCAHLWIDNERVWFEAQHIDQSQARLAPNHSWTAHADTQSACW